MLGSVIQCQERLPMWLREWNHIKEKSVNGYLSWWQETELLLNHMHPRLAKLIPARTFSAFLSLPIVMPGSLSTLLGQPLVFHPSITNSKLILQVPLNFPPTEESLAILTNKESYLLGLVSGMELAGATWLIWAEAALILRSSDMLGDGVVVKARTGTACASG